MRVAPSTLVGLAPLEAIHSSAWARHSERTSAGSSLMVTHIKPGRSKTSSTYPRTGMKSGIRSIGLSAYATTNTPRALAYQGVRRFWPANQSVTPSRLIRLAQALKLLLILINRSIPRPRVPQDTRTGNVCARTAVESSGHHRTPTVQDAPDDPALPELTGADRWRAQPSWRERAA